MLNEILEVPDEAIDQQVHVTINIILQGQKPGQIGFPGLVGTFLGQTRTSIQIRTNEQGLYGPPGKITIPKADVKGVNIFGGITTLPAGTRLST